MSAAVLAFFLPLPILGKGAVERALTLRKHKPIFMVDIAVPRDIEPEVGEPLRVEGLDGRNETGTRIGGLHR